MQSVVKIISLVSLFAALSLSNNVAQAAPIELNGQQFGTITTLDGSLVEFGGDGIPSDATSFSDFVDDEGNQLRLGLSITPRFNAPTPENDGAGTFFVVPGLDTNSIALWNFSWFAELNGETTDIASINLELLYDLDPASGTDESALGILALSAFADMDQLVAEGSQNASFGFLSTSGIPGVTVPSVSNFNPNSGEYSFVIRAEGYGSVGVNAVVNDVSAPLFGVFASAMIGGLLLRRKA